MVHWVGGRIRAHFGAQHTHFSGGPHQSDKSLDLLALRRAESPNFGLRVGPKSESWANPNDYLISKPSFFSEVRMVSRPFIDLSGPSRFSTRWVQFAA